MTFIIDILFSAAVASLLVRLALPFLVLKVMLEPSSDWTAKLIVFLFIASVVHRMYVAVNNAIQAFTDYLSALPGKVLWFVLQNVSHLTVAFVIWGGTVSWQGAQWAYNTALPVVVKKIKQIDLLREPKKTTNLHVK